MRFAGSEDGLPTGLLPAIAAAAPPSPSHSCASSARPPLKLPREQLREKIVTLPPEIAFLSHDDCPSAALWAAAEEAQRTGLDADALLLASRAIGEHDFYRALALHLNVPFVERGLAVRSGIDYVAACRAGIAPLSGANASRWLCAPRGLVLRQMLSRHARDGLIVTTPRCFAAFVRRANAMQIATDALRSVGNAGVSLSARQGPSQWARRIALAVVVILLCSLIVLPAFAMPVLLALFWGAFAMATMLRLFTAAASFDQPTLPPPLPDHNLPHYSIVVALYREASVAAALIEALDKIDYPRARLDIKLVVEADDQETAIALSRALRGFEYEIIVAPDGKPRTKPRALAVALPFVRGELVTVFDAEDVPQPDQLRKAAAHFAGAGTQVACLQARLAIDNNADGWLTSLFAIDYAALFLRG